MYVDEKILNQFSSIREVFKDQPIRRLISENDREENFIVAERSLTMTIQEVKEALLVIQCSNKELTPKQVDALAIAIDLIKRAKMKFIDCIEREKVLDDKNIITVQTKEYGSIEVIPVDTIADIELADVQPILNIKKLQEHIKQRILETAFNNGGIYEEVAEDIADRIDIWVDEFGRVENDT